MHLLVGWLVEAINQHVSSKRLFDVECCFNTGCREGEGGMYSQSMPKTCSTIDLLSSRAVPTLLLLALPQVNATN
jgi:hypothetical protein